MNTQHLETRRSLLPRMKERIQQHPTNTNNELILSYCEWQNSLCREMGWKRSTSHLNAGAQVRFECADHPWNITFTQDQKNIFLKNVLLVRIRRYSIHTEDVLSHVIEFIYSDFFIFNTMPFWNVWSVIFFLYFLHSMYVFRCKSKYGLLNELNHKSRTQCFL